MSSNSVQAAGTLLEALVQAADAHVDPTTLLHDSVTLHRLDGTTVSGRAAVADAVANHGTEVQFRVLRVRAETVDIAISVEGLPGHLRCTLSGVVSQGVLIEITMEATDSLATATH